MYDCNDPVGCSCGLDDLTDVQNSARVLTAYSAERSKQTAGPLKALFERTRFVLHPIYRNAVVIDAEHIDLKSTPRPVGPNFKI